MRRRSLLVAAVAAASGCGYTTRGLYPEQIRTVAVPIFKSNLFRRDIEFQLTQRVIQLIESRTHFKVVSAESAETEIRGTIEQFDKMSFGQDGFSNPRGGVMILTLKVNWIDKRTGQTLAEGDLKIDPEDQRLSANQSYAVDTAHSEATATAGIVEQLADYVVTMLQTPW